MSLNVRGGKVVKATKPADHLSEVWVVPPETPRAVVAIVHKIFAALGRRGDSVDRALACYLVGHAEAAQLGDLERQDICDSLLASFDEYVKKNRRANTSVEEVRRVIAEEDARTAKTYRMDVSLGRPTGVPTK